MNDIKVGSRWVCKDECVDVVEVIGVYSQVRYQLIGGSIYVMDKEDFLDMFKPAPIIYVGDTWVGKNEKDYWLRVVHLGGGKVFATNEAHEIIIYNLDDFITTLEPKVAEVEIAVGSVWRCKEDGELVYIESNDPSDLPYNINFSPLGDADLYANDTKGFLSQYEFVRDKVDIGDKTLKPTSAVDLLETSAATLVRCGKKYDSTGNNSERVMDRIVDMFNAATGHELTEAQGNIFMVCLKVVRSETSTYHDDDHYIDGVNYFAMAGEASSKNYKDNI